MKRALFALGLVLLTPATLRGEEPQATAERNWEPRLAPSVAFEAGYGEIGEDAIVTTKAIFGMTLSVPTLGCGDAPGCQTLFRFALQAPLRLVVNDAPPEQEGLVREEDWDRAGDYLRVIRRVEFGRPHEAVYLRAGELIQRTLGHGTIVDGYTNVVGPDRFEFGVQTNLSTRYGGLEFILDDVTAPEVVGGRIFVRPWGFASDNPALERIGMGVTLMADVDAPLTLETSGDDWVLESDERPSVLESETTWVAGFDVEFTSFEGETFAMNHYADGNLVADAPGVHLGTLVDLPFTSDVGLELRGEFRALGRGYIPGYFSPLHEIDRYYYLGWGLDLPAPKRRVVATIEDGGIGGLVAADLQITPWVVFGASFEAHEGPANERLTLRLDVGPIGPAVIGAYYYRQNADGAGDLLDLSESLAVVETRVAVWGPLYLHGSYMRWWRLAPDARYDTVDDWNAGAGAAFTF